MAVCEQNWQSYCKHRDIKRSAEQFLQRLKPISVALDLIQKDSCTIADAAEIWKTLKTNRDAKKIFQKTYWKVESQWTGENPKQIAWHQRLFVSFSKCWLLLYSFVCWHWESVFVIWLVYIVHSNLRNRLGLEKAGKLVFLFKLMNKKPVAGQEEHSYYN